MLLVPGAFSGAAANVAMPVRLFSDILLIKLVLAG
eukprot:XP_001709407.1 Hypothetical protein GL50803_36951 [Giardia lamblia ATCC 50803]